MPEALGSGLGPGVGFAASKSPARLRSMVRLVTRRSYAQRTEQCSDHDIWAGNTTTTHGEDGLDSLQ